jgi:hypothetical protein
MTTDAPVLWSPHSGPQTRFLAASEFEVLYGGAAGGGKSDALLFGALRQTDNASYRALILRHTYPELAELMDRAHGVFRRLGAVWNEQKKRWTFKAGAIVEFGYCETWKDVQRYQGQQFSYIGFDEVGNLAEERIWAFLMSRCRSGGPGILPMMRASANPGGPGHAWLRKRFIDACGMDGERVYVDPGTGLTRRFVPARLYDNPTLLVNNPQYEAQLKSLPDMLRRQLLEGDWDAGSGLALGELNRSRHLIDPFEIPGHWTQFGAFDWGYAHPFSFGWYTVDGDGNVYKVDTVTGRRLLPHEIHERIAARVPLDKLKYIAGGLDLWNTIKAKGENTPPLAEQFWGFGWKLQKANVDRVSGLNNMRRYVTWRPATEDEPIQEPAFRLMDTEGNRRCFDQLSAMVSDPDDPEDALKVDGDPDTGEGGDDMYDETRYALASRPRKAGSPPRPPKPARYDDGFEKVVEQKNKAREQQIRNLKRILKGGYQT